jgi:hypothetical protein
LDRAFDRITQWRPAQVLHRLTRYKAHFSQTRSDPIHAVNADNSAALSRAELIERGRLIGGRLLIGGGFLIERGFAGDHRHPL